MAKVIQVRNVPDDVHAMLVTAAEKAGLSLTAFVNGELAKVARAVDPVEHNRRVIEQLRAEIGVIDVSREESRRILDEARAELDERADRIVERYRRSSA